jgi:hypothetical protein
MANDLDRTITYSFILTDEATATANKMGASAKSADADVKSLTSSEQTLSANTEVATAKINTQKIQLASQVAIIMGVKEATSAAINGVISLGLVSDSTALQLQKVNAAFQIMGGLATGVKALQLAMTSLNLATLKNAVLNTYNSVISNPGKIALLGLAIGAGAGAAIALGATYNNSSSTSTQIVVEGSTTAGTNKAVQDLYMISTAGDVL